MHLVPQYFLVAYDVIIMHRHGPHDDRIFSVRGKCTRLEVNVAPHFCRPQSDLSSVILDDQLNGASSPGLLHANLQMDSRRGLFDPA